MGEGGVSGRMQEEGYRDLCSGDKQNIQNVLILILGTCKYVTLYDKRNHRWDSIKNSEVGDYPGLSRCPPPPNHKGLYKRKKKAGGSEAVAGDVTLDPRSEKGRGWGRERSEGATRRLGRGRKGPGQGARRAPEKGFFPSPGRNPPASTQRLGFCPPGLQGNTCMLFRTPSLSFITAATGNAHTRPRPAHSLPGPPDLPGGTPFLQQRAPSSHRDIAEVTRWSQPALRGSVAEPSAWKTRAAATSAGGPESPSDCPVQSTWAQGLLGACPQWRLFRTRLKEQVEINAIKRETWASMGFGVSRGRCGEGGARGLRAAGASARPCSGLGGGHGRAAHLSWPQCPREEGRVLLF